MFLVSRQKTLIIIACASLVALLNCARVRFPATPPQRKITDGMGRVVALPLRVERAVSLAPNLTEIVFAIGAGPALAGRTTYCDYPKAASSVAEVGDTLHPNVERIFALKPDVVLISTSSQLETFTRQLEEQGIAVIVTDPKDISGVIESIRSLGAVFGREAEAHQVIADLSARIQSVEHAIAGRRPVTVFYQVSASPLYTAGRESYITDLIQRAGGRSVTAEVAGAWPLYSAEAVVASRPEAVVLPAGGSMGEANRDVASALAQTPAVRNQHVYRINGDFLSRPGPRLVDGLEMLARSLHPEAFKQ